MQRWVNIIETNCDPTREAEYNEWYDGIHIPDVLKTPGFLRARRYEAREFRDARGKYMAVYDIETDDIEATMKVRLERRAEEHRRSPASANRPNLTRPVWRDVLWQQISERRA